MEKKRILILTDQMPWGHRSIAKAIYSYLKSQEKDNNFTVDYTEVRLQFPILNEMYMAVYRYVPSAGKIAHKVMKNTQARKIFLDLLNYNLPDLIKQINRYKPDLVISSYFMHSQALARWREVNRKSFKLWTVAADPWTVNPISFVDKADLHLVYDEVAEKDAKRFGIKSQNILKSGWWVRPELYDQKYQDPKIRTQIRKKLGFDDQRRVIFVGGGSLGTTAVSKIMPALMLVRKPVGVVFNTGTDKFTHNLVEEYVKMFRRLRKDNLVQIKNLGWIENMAEILSACDMVFGKAGPNFLFDVVAVKKPFVSITHIGGQEDGNISLILKKHLGWVKEKNGSVGEFLLSYLEDPDKYEQKYIKNIEEESKSNQKTMPLILERVKRELGQMGV